MKRAGDILLLLVQWALVLWGCFLILVALHLYSIESRAMETMALATPGQDGYVRPTFQRMVQGVTTGLIAVGLGAALFYLRRLFLARRPK